MIESAHPVKCPACEHESGKFVLVMRYKRIPALAAASPADIMVNFQFIVCLECEQEFTGEVPSKKEWEKMIAKNN